MQQTAILDDASFVNQLMDATPMPIYFKDRFGRYMACSAAFAQQILGLPISDIIGRTHTELHDLIPQYPVDPYHQNDSALMQHPGKQVYQAEVQCPDGRLRPFEFHKTVLSNQTGQCVGFVVVMKELTEWREAERAWMDVANELTRRLEATPIPTFVIDHHHIVTHWNQACENLTAIPAADIIGTQDQWRAFYRRKRPVLADLIVDGASEVDIASYYEEKYRISDAIEGAYEAEDYFADIGPTGKWLFFTAAPLRDDAGRIVGAVETLQDFTERRVAEERLEARDRQLRDQTRHLAEVNRALKSMLDHREVEKKAIEGNMLLNLQKFVYPYLERLQQCRLDTSARTYLEIMVANINDLIASHAKALSVAYLTLTPKEIEIADLIRQGKSTKEIAELVFISAGSVGFHRNNIRRKLGLLNRKVNLRTYLNSLA